MMEMDSKRIASGFIVALAVVVMLLVPNKYIIGILLGLIALVSMDEYLKAISKVCKPIKWVAYLSCILVLIPSLIPQQQMQQILI